MKTSISETENIAEIKDPCAFRAIYIYRLDGVKSHEGKVKIGDTQVRENVPASELPPNCEILQRAAKKRVADQTKTAGLFDCVEILHIELAVDKNGEGFRDHRVHNVLKNSGVERANLSGEEWFKCDLETAKNAIVAAKECRNFLGESQKSENLSPIEFRPEQKQAIQETVRRFKKQEMRKNFLWNAKMRFGKTLCALEVVRQMEFKRTIIVTHRPAVKASWGDDFKKIFFRSENKNCRFGVYPPHAEMNCPDFTTLESECQKNGSPYVLFVSIQFLRNQKNRGIKDKILHTPWDFLIIDEGHEGTQTTLGQDVLQGLRKSETCCLALSGTPFNFMEKYSKEETFTWNYIDEQRAKLEWDKNHPDEPNPYASLPRLNIRTYSLGNVLDNPAKYMDVADKAFSFSEFFRIGESGNFAHENDVKKFLDLLVGKYPQTKSYPFANEEYRKFFKHSFWVVPGVKEAKRLTELLAKHDVFGKFKVVNVAGDGNVDEDDEQSEALARVKDAIKNNDYTITISCGRLTTGITVPEWTAVFYLAGSYQTSVSAYMQTIFRVQSPGSVNGRLKEECFVFDFAPDRTLSMIEQVAQYSAGDEKRAEGREKKVREYIREFINFASVISFEGSATRKIDTAHVLECVNKMCIAQIVRQGFCHPKIFNNKIWNLSEADMSIFDGLKKSLPGSMASSEKINSIVISSEGLDQPQNGYGEGDPSGGNVAEDAPTRKSPQLSKEEKQRRKRRETAMAILFLVTARCPLLAFGANGEVEKTFSPEDFPENFDDTSWKEFMGNLTKEDFKRCVAPFLEVSKFAAACMDIREGVKKADKLAPLERIREISNIHSKFKKTDKETVLTPWRVVNMQLSDTLGGYNFFDEKFEKLLDQPKFVNHGKETAETLGNAKAKILEINSKTGLYPLYVAYSLMREKLDSDSNSPRRGESIGDAEKRLWKSVVAENIFVVCRTKMAAAITRRTLLGFDEKTHANICVKEDLTELAGNVGNLKKLAENENDTKKLEKILKKLEEELEKLRELRVPATFNKNLKSKKMLNFNAIVGNPPYQKMDGGAQASATPVYQHFVRLAKDLAPEYFSLIVPARWYAGGKGLDDFRKEMLDDKRIQKLFDYIDPKACFENVDIKGGVCYFLWNKNYHGKCEIHSHTFEGTRKGSRRFLREEGFGDIFIRDERMISILKKIVAKDGKNYKRFSELVSAMKPYGIRGDFFANPAKHGLPKIYEKRHSDTDLKIYGLLKNKRDVRYVPADYPIPKKEGVDKFKIFVTRNYGCGEVGEVPATPVLATPVLATPGEICTETFLQISPCDTKEERDNVFSYLKTKFFRLLVGIRKQDQNASHSVYSFVPVQDFSKPWTDAELYEKYALAKTEIEFIEKMIRPM